MNRKVAMHTLFMGLFLATAMIGCRTTPGQMQVDLLNPPATAYEQERDMLRDEIESARERGDSLAERDALTEYSHRYDLSSSLINRELDLDLELNQPERVVMLVDRLPAEQITRAVLIRLGKAFEMQGEHRNAAEAYERALAEKFDHEILDLFMAVRMKISEEEMSIELQQYGDSPWITRDELAHILVYRFKKYLPVGTRPPVIMDIDQSSQEDALLTAVAAGLFHIGRDHRVLPSARIRKLDLAKAFLRIMHFAGKTPDPDLINNLELPYDLTPRHSAWEAVSACFAAGLLGAEPDGRFKAGKIMNGSDIIFAVEALSFHLNYR
ncbi:hypothetical protein K8T06_09315 [bacterium]|nr:hypothetical protein [bacterium]